MNRSKLVPLMISLSLGVLAAAVVLWFDAVGQLEALKGAAQDLRFYVRGKREPPEDITIVTWDEDTFDELGLRYQDWPRTYHARVIENLARMGARLIGFDILIDNRSRLPEEDKALAKAIEKAVQKGIPVIFDAFLDETQQEIGDGVQASKVTLLSPNEVFLDEDEGGELKDGANFALVNLQPDPDGFVRRWAPAFYWKDQDWVMPSFPLYLLALAEKENPSEVEIKPKSIRFGHKELPIKGNSMLINYYGPNRTFRTVPYYQVYRYPGRYREIKKWIKDKIVLVGIYTQTLGRDVHFVPFSRFGGSETEAGTGKRMPGVEVMANVLATMLTRNFITELPVSTKNGLVVFLGLFGGLIFYRLGFLWGAVVLLLGVIALLFLSLVIFSSRSFIIPFLSPALSLLLTYGGVTLYRGLTEEREKRRIRSVFSRYVTDSVVEEVLNNPEAQVLGGKKKECTIYFSDIRGFTSISENLSPEEVVSLLNEYFTEMHRIINKYEGTLDKYIGDAIMAIWGAPATHPDDVERALKASLEMKDQAKVLSKKWQQEGKKTVFEIGAGLNTDAVVVGNIGSQERQDYTVIGDGVNLASRLEGLNKVYGTQIIVGENVYRRAREKFVFRPLDVVAVKGKKKGVRIYELVGHKDGVTEEEEAFCEHFAEGFESYLRQDWDKAMAIFQKLKEQREGDVPTDIYLDRCQELKQNPPGHEWDGIARMTTK